MPAERAPWCPQRTPMAARFGTWPRWPLKVSPHLLAPDHSPARQAASPTCLPDANGAAARADLPACFPTQMPPGWRWRATTAACACLTWRRRMSPLCTGARSPRHVHLRAYQGVSACPESYAAPPHCRLLMGTLLPLPAARCRAAQTAGKALSIAWHPSGERLVSGHSDGCIRLWQAATGDPPLSAANMMPLPFRWLLLAELL